MQIKKPVLLFLLFIGNLSIISAQDTLFFEDFDQYPGSKPPGWTTEIGPNSIDFQFINGGGTKTPGIPASRRPPNAYSDTVNALYFFESIGKEYTYLVTPPVNLEFAVKPELRFQHAQIEDNLGPGDANDELRIYYKTHPDSTWAESKKIGEYTDPVVSWTEQTILIPEEALVPACYFAFKAKTNYGPGVCIDDVSILETGEQQRQLDTIAIFQENSDFIPNGTVNNPILRIEFSVKGNTGDVTLNSLDLISLNTSDADIITNGVKLFYNYLNQNFYEAVPLDTVSFSSEEASFSELSFSLPTGKTNFWVTYDIESAADHGNLADAMIPANGIDIDGNTYPDTDVSPPGTRLIRESVFTDDFSTDKGWTLAGDFERNRPRGIGGNYIGNPDPAFAAWDTVIIGNDLSGLGGIPGDYEPGVARYGNLATSPSFDLTYYNDVKLSFLRWLNVANNDTASIEMSMDDGSSWNEIWANNNQVFTDGSWTFFSQDMTGGNRESNVKLRINLGPTTMTGHFSGWNIEDLAVTGNYVEYDVGPTALLAPGQGCGHTSAETVQIRVGNFGPGATPDTIPVRYSFDGGDTFTTDTLTGAISFGGETTFDFSQSVDLSVPGIYNVVIETALDVDEESTNDSYDTVLYVDPVYTVPYYQDFEEEMDYWRITGTNSSFEYGTPLGGIIHEAASGGRAWVTNLDGDYYNNEDAYLVGPCFSLSGIDYPVFECQIFTSMEPEDGANLEYSLDGGQTWSRVGNMGDGDAYGWNWYNSDTISGLDGNQGWTGDTTEWRTARIMLDTMVFRDAPSVKFRFHFVSDEALRIEGLGIDDIRIYDLPRDLGVIAIRSPVAACAQDIGDHVTVTLQNFGLDTLMAGDTLIVGYDLESDSTVIDTFLLEANLLEGDTMQYSFKKYLNVTSSGTKYIEAFSLLPDDIDFYNEGFTNDSTSKSFDVELTPFVFLPAEIYTVRPDTIILDAYTGVPTDTYLWQDGSTDSVFHVTAMTDGVYYVTASNTLCDYRDTTYVYKLIADVGVTGIIHPVDACELGSTVQPQIEVTNFGTDTLHVGDTIPVRYSLDGGTVAEENAVMTGLVYPDSTFEYTFATTADMSAIKTYSVKSYTSLDYDDSALNDTIETSAEVFGITQIDLGADTIVRALEWTLDAGPGYDTYLWQDSTTSQTFIADTTGWYRVTVKEGTRCENSDSLHLIMVVPDVKFNRIHNPVDACMLSSTENLDLYVVNAGSDTLTAQDTVPVTYRVDTGPVVRDTLFVDRIVLPGDSILFSSSGTVDLSSPAVYQFRVSTLYGKDLVPGNDTIHRSIEVYGNPIFSLGPDTIVNAKTYGLDAGAGFATYLWQDGSANQDFTVLYEDQSPDSIYRVTVTDDNGCQGSDQVRVTFAFYDIGVDSILTPASACVLTDQEELKIWVKNYGTLTLTEQLQIKALLDQEIPVTGQKTLTQGLNPGDSLEFIFGIPFDLSDPGDHKLVIYTVYGRDINAGNDTLERTISHFGNPVIDLEGVNDTLMTSLPDTLDAGADYVSYTWNDVAGGRTYITNTYGWHKLEVTDMNGCYAIDSVYLTKSTGLHLLRFENHLKVYPNPAGDVLHLEFLSPDEQDVILELFSPLGEKILIREYPHAGGRVETLDVSGMPGGMYYLRMNMKDRSAVMKIIIR